MKNGSDSIRDQIQSGLGHTKKEPDWQKAYEELMAYTVDVLDTQKGRDEQFYSSLPLNQSMRLNHFDENGSPSSFSLTKIGSSLLTCFFAPTGTPTDYFAFEDLDQNEVLLVKSEVTGLLPIPEVPLVRFATLFSDLVMRHMNTRGIESKSLSSQLREWFFHINDHFSEWFSGSHISYQIFSIDESKGECDLIHANDPDVLVWRKADQKLRRVTLPNAPAAGYVNSGMIEINDEMAKPSQIRFCDGDLMISFSSGLAETRRYLRKDSRKPAEFGSFSKVEIQRILEGYRIPLERSHGDKPWDRYKCESYTELAELFLSGKSAEIRELETLKYPGGSYEILGAKRLVSLINATLQRSDFHLLHMFDGRENETLTFDFSMFPGTSFGKMEDCQIVSLAVVSVLTVFTMFRLPEMGPADQVRIENRLVEFLKITFREFDEFFDQIIAHDDSVTTFSHLGQDVPVCDLTLLAYEQRTNP